MTEAAIRKAAEQAEPLMRDVKDGGLDDTDLNLVLADKERNDIGNAERLLMRFGDNLCYVEKIGWHYWDGTRWCAMGADGFVRKKAHETTRLIMAELMALQAKGKWRDQSKSDFDDELASMAKWSIASGNMPRIRAMLNEAAPYCTLRPDQFDRDQLLVNTLTGIIPLEGACEFIRPHKREDYLTKIMPVEYDPNQDAHRFRAFLQAVQPDAAVQRFLQVWAG